ncbi:MAG TPA: transcription termination factor NusA [Tepidisphaeraceae bacterium]|jgi:N utilization substance protein A|nr:transcription termination factor NusA [Tepidisphaeraceae bacterium]
MNAELIRIVDGIARDKNIEREQIYSDIEQAIASGLRKQFNTEDTSEFTVAVDRTTGDISFARQGQPLSLGVMGRIGAQTVKQVMIQLIRQDERGSVYEEYKDRVGTIVTGTIARFEGGTMIVNLGRAEGIMPRSEQIPGEAHQVGERVQALIMEVRDTLVAVKIILSRSHPELIRRLFEREVPEVGERTIEIKALAREAGHRTKIAVSSIDSKVDAVGACVGVRGSRIKNIVDELGGEKIDIVRWNESSQILIGNALKPAEVTEVALCFELGRATVVVNEDQLSLAIGKRGQNVRLAARLTGWDVDILTPAEFQAGVQRLDQTLKGIEGVTQEMVDKIIALGLIDVRDIEEVGVGPLTEEVGMTEELAQKVVDRCSEEAKIVTVEQEKKKAAEAVAKASARAALAAAPAPAVDTTSFESALRGEGDGQQAAEAPVAGESSEATEAEPGEIEENADRMPGALESADGGAPEVMTHSAELLSSTDELSPEERAVTGGAHKPDPQANFQNKMRDENDETEALAEGRAVPPPPSPDDLTNDVS